MYIYIYIYIHICITIYLYLSVCLFYLYTIFYRYATTIISYVCKLCIIAGNTTGAPGAMLFLYIWHVSTYMYVFLCVICYILYPKP